MTAPAAVPVKLTEQIPFTSAQEVGENETEPPPKQRSPEQRNMTWDQVTWPEGEVPTTVALQPMDEPTSTEEGVQLMTIGETRIEEPLLASTRARAIWC